MKQAQQARLEKYVNKFHARCLGREKFSETNEKSCNAVWRIEDEAAGKVQTAIERKRRASTPRSACLITIHCVWP